MTDLIDGHQNIENYSPVQTIEIGQNNQCDLTYIINTLFYDSDKIDFYSIETIKSDYLRWKVHDGTYYEWDGKNSAVVFDKENFGKKI